MNVSHSRKGCVRACERCRKSKVRCLTDAVDRNGKCKRCYEAAAECVFPVTTGPQQRRRRTEVRIASIEEKLATINAAIAKEPGPQMPTPSSPSGMPDGASRDDTTPGRTREHTADFLANTDGPASSRGEALGWNQPRLSIPTEDLLADGDAIPGYLDRSLLSSSQARALLSDFRNQVVHEYPIVVLSDRDSFDRLRLEKPVFLFAVVTSASRGRYPTLFQKLHRKLQRVLAERTILEGQKSLELIQAILVMEAWYCPPDDLNRLNFCQWANIAGGMALQLGLIGVGTYTAHRAKNFRHIGMVGDGELACWRSVIVVSLAVSTIAISLHRQAIFSLTYASRHFFEALGESTTLVNDQRLIAWARLQLVSEHIEALRMDTPAYTNHHALRLDLEKLETHLDEWRQSLAPDVMNGSLNIHFLYCRCRLFELVMLTELRQNQESALGTDVHHTESSSMQQVNISITPYLVKAVMTAIQCSHGIIDVICQMSVQLYLDCPTVTTIRALYAINTLSALQKSFVEHHTVVSKIVDKSTIMLDRYSRRLRTFLHKAKGSEEHVVPKMVLSTLDQAARQPYLLRYPALQEQTTYPDQVVSSGAVSGADISPHNDLEATVESTMPDSTRTEQGFTPTPSSLGEMLHRGHGYHFSLAQASDSAPALQLPGPESTDTGFNHLSEFDLMCMPDLMTGTSSWPLIEEYEINAFTPGLDLGLQASAPPSSAWL